MAVPKQLEVYAEVACPFAHVSLRHFAERRREEGLQRPVLIVRAWPLELVNGRRHSPEHLAPEVDALRASVAPDLFAGFDPDHFPSTSLPALGATAAAYRAGPQHGEAFALAVRDALWEDGLDIADVGVLEELARTLDVPTAVGADMEAVRRDHVRGQTRGVDGSPHFFTADQDFFAPTLHIEGQGHEMVVRTDVEGTDALWSAIVD